MNKRLKGAPALVIGALVAAGLLSGPLAAVAQEAQGRGSTGSASRLPDLAAYAMLPGVSNVAVSPDGTGLAWIVPDQSGGRSVVYANRTTRTHRVIDVPRTEPTSLRFEDGGALLISAVVIVRWEPSDDIARLGRVIVHHPDTGQTYTLQPTWRRNVWQTDVSYGLESIIPEAPNRVALIGTSPRSMWGETILPYFYTLDLRTGETLVEVGGRTETVDWLGGADGEPLARVDFDARSRRGALLVRDPGGDAWETAIPFENAAVPPFKMVARKGADQIILEVSGTEYGRYKVLDARTKAVSELVTGDGVEIGGLILEPGSNQLLGLRLEGLRPTVRWLEPGMQALQVELDARHPGQTVTIGSMSTDRSVVAFSVSTDTTPETWYLLDRSAEQPQRIGHTYPALVSNPGVRFEATQFTARDGLEIPVYVTYPAGWDRSKPGPMVVMPHGGPQARDYPGFDWWVQFMVSRGYAVVQPQFRGSTGFGQAFADAGFQQWGRKMQDDVTDAVRWATAQGLADPERVCIVGASYGGYAALAGAALTPDLYACVVSVAGISDLRALLRSDRRASGGADTIATNYWAEHIGDLGDRGLDAVSPIRLVDQIRAPVLLMHGDLDSVVPIAQSQTMAQALRRAGRDVILVELPVTDHGLSFAQGRLRMLQEIETFLASHLGAPMAAPGTSADNTTSGTRLASTTR